MIDFSDIKGGAGGSYLKFEADGDTHVFFIPTSSVMEQRRQVWAGNVSRDATDLDNPKDVSVKLATDVQVIVGGKPQAARLEASSTTWGKVASAAKTAGGTLHDHVYSLERIGAKGDKKTVYRAKVVGKASDYAGMVTDAPAPKAEDTNAEIVKEILRLKMTPVQVAAALVPVAPGVTNPTALNAEQATAFLASLRGMPTPA